MDIPFVKYQGTGNDFVLIDQRVTAWIDHHDAALIERLCDRRFGIGADGLMLLQNLSGYDFEMVYFNADGKPSTMCGNGGRCIVHYAHSLGACSSHARFMAVDGEHLAVVHTDHVALQMQDVTHYRVDGQVVILDTGSPHYVYYGQDHGSIEEYGREIRYSPAYVAEGINVNIAKRHKDGLLVSTYERGVEAETMSCGTGVTAAAIGGHLLGLVDGPVKVYTKGGDLQVSLEAFQGGYRDIWLRGPATLVYEGVITV